MTPTEFQPTAFSAVPVGFKLPTIIDLTDPDLTQRLQARLDNKTKPVGSLGRLEVLAVRLGLILGTIRPELHHPQMVVFAADHGLAAHGVSAYPSDVTWQMVSNFLAGGAAVSVLARQHALALTVVDCGVRHEFPTHPQLQVRKVAAGSQDMLHAMAMTPRQCAQALQHGMDLVRELPGNVLLLGEMGIGNTSAASLLLAQFTGKDLVDCTGAGTGLTEAGLQAKLHVLRQVQQRHQKDVEAARISGLLKPEAWGGTAAGVVARHEAAALFTLASLGGLEVATMVGAVLQAAFERKVIIVDGFIASAAVMAAAALRPQVLQRCVFAHRSSEHAHGQLLEHLKAEPLLDWGLRLGEGSGAALAWPLVASASRILIEMASFEDAGVSRQAAGG